MQHDVVIVGGGLFGEIIAKALRQKGRECLIIDRDEKEAGSRPAACLMKPSWYSGLGKDVHVPALTLLDELYGIREVEFKVAMTKTIVNWIPPALILGQEARIHGDVVDLKVGVVFYKTPGGTMPMQANLIIVAAGIWTQQLVPSVVQTAQKGIAFLDPTNPIDQPFIKPWAPYKQIVAFNRGDGLWVNDGTAILEKNWTEERETQCARRCQDAVGGLSLRNTRSLVGIRPYAKGHKPCLLEEIEPGLWVVSGGAKNGTLAAGWCGHIIGEATS